MVYMQQTQYDFSDFLMCDHECYCSVLIADVADSYIKISACLTQLATADNSNLDK